ncbi:ABC transporter substrate-binding protein [Alicyclobacillus kakegawensis]|uniref:ABC transporter substrate-binding protein n=1 Tax=Alicyclobacillus kakegawensis TaxID=392012 RepID=UPI000836FB17|nr:extracellular solute-binding protein [Alicyclobacillus kakegawensis]
MKGMEKVLCVLAVVGMSGGLLSACGTTGSSGSTTVTVWSWRSQDAPLWQKVQDALNKKGDNIKIQFRSIQATNYDSVLQTAMDGGQGPDIMYQRAGEGTEQYAAANMLKPLDKIVNFSNITNQSALEAAQYKGKTYGVPFAIQTMEVFYNTDIFKKYDLQPPKTWADFINICKVLKRHGVTPLEAMGIQGWMLALNFDEIGATFLGNKFTQQLVDKKVNYTNPAFVDALAHYQQLSAYFEPNFKAVGSAGNEQETNFALGKSAMVMDGIFDIPTIEQDNKNLHIGAFLIPPEKPSQQSRIDWYVDGNISMNNDIKNPQVEKAAEEVIKYVATTAFGQDFSDIAGEISPIKGVTISPKYPLSVQAYQWYQTRSISPVFGIRSPMDTPPPTPINSKKGNKSVNDTNGIFSAEQKVLLPLLTHQMTPKHAAQEIQKTVSWYFR